jgi:hypothetical protein
MKINWIFSSTYNPGPEIDLEAVKNIGSSWGSWRSWRSCGTDNVICHDRGQAETMLARSFQKSCNFYIPQSTFQALGRPVGVRLFDGEYQQEVLDLEDIIALHLVSGISDLVLMAGFDLSTPEPVDDKLTKHRIQNRLGLLHQLFVSNPTVQWVLVDHPKKPDLAYSKLENLTCDEMKSVLQLLK